MVENSPMATEKVVSAPLDKLKWLVVGVLFAGGIAANYVYEDVNLSLRLIAWIVLFGVTLGIAATTVNGKRALIFSRAARSELRKVVWPTRPETVRTTIMVIVLILIVGLILWGVDAVLLWAVSLVTK